MKFNLFCFIIFSLNTLTITSNFIYPSAFNDNDVEVIERDVTVKRNITQVPDYEEPEYEEPDYEEPDYEESDIKEPDYEKLDPDEYEYEEIYTGSLSITTHLPEDPCVPSPCRSGFWHWCQEFNSNARCICLPNYVRSPPKCIPECTVNSECIQVMACIHNRCRDPCLRRCGNNAHCNVDGHRPHCTCLPGFTGQPWKSCYSMLQAPPNLSCSPSPCGPHSHCREVESQAICRCQINSMGTPPKCRPECTMNSECASDKACFNRKCVDPCVYSCARNANCTVIAHNPICSCQDGFAGDPFTNCIPLSLERPEINPCIPSPCGPNSRCQEFNGNASCTCLPNYISSPPRCRPECTVDSECNEDMACINNWCGDPCPVACGNYAECFVKYHVPYCTCLPDSCQALDQTFGFLQYPVRGHKFGFPEEESVLDMGSRPKGTGGSVKTTSLIVWPYDIPPGCYVNCGTQLSSFEGPDCPSGSAKFNEVCVETV